MSRADKPAKPSAISQLKKDLKESVKVIQSLTTSLEKLDNGFSDAEMALTNERSLKDKLSMVQGDLIELRETHKKAQNELRGEITKFADVTMGLTQEYQVRSTQLKSDYESKLQDLQRREKSLELKWKQQVDLERAEICRLKQAESHGKNEIESQVQKAKENWQKKEEQLRTSLKQCDHRIVELSEKNKALNKELSDHETMLKGRDTEIQRLGGRLAAIEAFEPEDVMDKLINEIAKLQTSLREFCLWFVDSAEILPGWNQFPDGIRYEHLPGLYSSDSPSGRYVFMAAIQHSICTAMKRNFLPPFGPWVDHGFREVSEALFRNNQSHEAIWRLMTIKTILGDQQMIEKYKANLHEVAKSLLSSWKPFPGDSQKKETLEKLTLLLIDSATIFLELQKVRKRIHVSIDVVSQYFDSDSEDDSHNVPGGFELPDTTAPVLCLFPAFFWTTSPAATSNPNLLRKGRAMFRDSPPLLAALNDEQEARSPKMSNKRRPTN